MAIMNQVEELEDGTVTVPLFAPSTWYPRGGKGWSEALKTPPNNSESVLKVLGNPDYLQTAQENSKAYDELMKGYKSDSLSASPLGPM